MTTGFDRYSSGHFIMGSVNYLVLKSANVPLLLNFAFANTIHLFVELMEHNKDPHGVVLETWKNHVGDIISFFAGWMLSYLLSLEVYMTWWMYPVLWVCLICTFLIETVREIFPHFSISIFTGAFQYKMS